MAILLSAFFDSELQLNKNIKKRTVRYLNDFITKLFLKDMKFFKKTGVTSAILILMKAFKFLPAK
ncbi:hypothetical protein GCM10023330_00390 [Litoribaculum gwangyangense]|uniref:ABC transmembrane type-1 domain-containing protein n=1 Tax=Litoribaculum gwangyangense TaxID=1130722 RepID=A0ABP9BQK3_9FLAO